MLNVNLRLAVVITIFLLCFSRHAWVEKVDGYNYVIADQLDQTLDLPIAKFTMDANDVLRFADELRFGAGIALCLEMKLLFPLAAPGDEQAEAPLITPIEMTDTTPRQILNAFTLARPDYTWLHVSGNRVNLLPTEYLKDAAWRGHIPTGTWSVEGSLSQYLRKLVNFTMNSAQPLTTSTEIQQVQTLWEKHPHLLENRSASIHNREATLLEAFNALGEFGPDIVWTLNGPYYQLDTIPLDEVYPASFQHAEAYRKQADAQQDAAIALYQMAFEEAPYADLKVRVGMAIMEVYLGRSMMKYTPQPEKAAQMCKLLLDAQPKYPYDATLWRQYIPLLYGMGREKDAQWAVRATCPPGAADSYACAQAKELVLWMATMYEKPEDQIAYLLSKQNLFPEDPYFNDELDAQISQLQNGVAIENAPKHNPYAQFNRAPAEEAGGVGNNEEAGAEEVRERRPLGRGRR